MRTILGPALAAFTVAALATSPSHATDGQGDPVTVGLPAPVVKADPTPTLVGVDADAQPLGVQFTVPAYDLATHHKLCVITVVVMPQGHGEPTTAEGWLESSYAKGALDVSANQSGGEVKVNVADVPAGNFVGQVLYSYDE